jgi:hypothetical protein
LKGKKMALQTITIKIVGRRPLMMHNPASMQGGGASPKLGRKNIPTPEVEAEASAYRMEAKNGKGQLYARGDWFQGALRKGASGLRIGKVSAKTVLAAGLMVTEERCPIYYPKTGKPIHDYVIDSRRAVVQSQGIIRSRAKLEEWACSVVCEYDDEILTPNHIEQLFNRAGQYGGVGDQRPGAPKTPGPFGVFTASIAK